MITMITITATTVQYDNNNSNCVFAVDGAAIPLFFQMQVQQKDTILLCLKITKRFIWVIMLTFNQLSFVYKCFIFLKSLHK